MKIVVNTNQEDFELSGFAIQKYLQRKKMPCFLYKYKSTFPVREIFEKTDSINGEVVIVIQDLGPNPTNDEIENVRFDPKAILRNDIDLVAILEEFGSKRISGPDRSLHIIEIPDDVDWIICDYDGGFEWVAERHRIWEWNGED